MRYTDEELMLCVYVTLHNHEDIGHWSIICQVNDRSLVSVKLKIWSVRKTIDAYIRRIPDIRPFKSVDPWRIERYVEMSQAELREECLHFLRSQDLL